MISTLVQSLDDCMITIEFTNKRKKKFKVYSSLRGLIDTEATHIGYKGESEIIIFSQHSYAPRIICWGSVERPIECENKFQLRSILNTLYNQFFEYVANPSSLNNKIEIKYLPKSSRIFDVNFDNKKVNVRELYKSSGYTPIGDKLEMNSFHADQIIEFILKTLDGMVDESAF